MAPNNPDLQQADEVIQSMAAEAGFDVTPAIDGVRLLACRRATPATSRPTTSPGPAAIDPDGNLWPFLHTGGTFNYGHYDSPAMDNTLDRARATTDPEERRALYRDVVERERRDLPLIYLWTPKNLVGLRKEVTGFVQVPDGLIRLTGVSFAR